MGKLIIGFFLLPTFSLAQDFFHDTDIPCRVTQSCLLNQENGANTYTRLITTRSELGYIYYRLNTRSTAPDTFSRSGTLCYMGAIRDICRIGALLVDNTNTDYTQGGHSRASDYSCRSINRKITIQYREKSDYVNEDELVVLTISPCQ